MRVRLSLALLPLLLTGCTRARQREPLARAKGAWYWHNPVALTEEEDGYLSRMGITELYPLAGTFSNDGERLVLRLRRKFLPVPATVRVRQIHLVYRFDRGAVGHALDEEPEQVAEAIARAFVEDRTKAQSGEWRVKGLQLDLDCPTRRLARYGEILTSLRKKVPKDVALSITGLGDWLNGDVAAALRPVDFWCPQLYEFDTPRELSNLEPISAIGRLDAYRPRLEALGVPYRVGIAAHGQALLYRGGQLDGTAQGISPSQAALRYPAESSVSTVEGEERAAYRVGPDRVLLFRRPDPRAVRQALEARTGGSKWDAGYVLFRVAELEEELTPSLATLALGPQPRDVTIKAEEVGDPFGAIERGTPGVDRAITLAFTSVAKTAPPLATDGLESRLSVAPGSIASISPGDFPNLRLVDGNGQGPVSLARAAGAIGTAPGIPAAGLRLGPIVKRAGGSKSDKLRVVARVQGYGREATVQKEL